jgi:hypothetical protein
MDLTSLRLMFYEPGMPDWKPIYHYNKNYAGWVKYRFYNPVRTHDKFDSIPVDLINSINSNTDRSKFTLLTRSRAIIHP